MGPKSGLTYNPALDGVRALAALSVVAYHSDIQLFRGGIAGVDIFFVLSGFLITSLLRGELAETGTLKIGAFLARRIVRLMPALLVFLCFIAYLLALFWPRADLWQEVGLPALYLTDYSRAMFNTPTETAHTWSLSLEMHFYLIWPFFILATRRLDPRRLCILLLALFAAATLWRAANIHVLSDWQRTYYSLDTHFSGLILGAFIAVLPWRPQRLTALWMGIFAFIILTLCVSSAPAYVSATLSLGVLIVELATAVLIVSFASPMPNTFAEILSAPALVRLGVWSYGIYLWHYPFTYLLRNELDPAPTFMISAALSIFMAALSYEFIERPLRGFARNFGHATPHRKHAMAPAE